MGWRWVAAGLLAAAAAFPLAGQNTGQTEKLHRAADKAMAGRAGALVVIDVRTGTILAAHDLNLAAHGLARPGSTVKPFVLKALLESGRVDAEQKLVCRRVLRIGGVKMDCTHPAVVVNMNADEALAYSCNSYFAEMAPRLTAEELQAALRKAGLDAPSGLVKEQSVGRIEKAETREALQLQALGDRGIEVTALELLGAYRKLALQRASGNDAVVFAGLEESVAYGMAHAANVSGMKVAGKTGTAASRTRTGTHGFFAGYAPAENPEIAIVVYLPQGRGMDAAAVARSVLAEFAESERKR